MTGNRVGMAREQMWVFRFYIRVLEVTGVLLDFIPTP